jgi:hypothetical protein
LLALAVLVREQMVLVQVGAHPFMEWLWLVVVQERKMAVQAAALQALRVQEQVQYLVSHILAHQLLVVTQ